jgi:hypothetical protein
MSAEEYEAYLETVAQREQAIERVHRLMKPRVRGVETYLVASGVGTELEVTLRTYLFELRLPRRTIEPGSKLFDAVLAMRDKTLESHIARWRPIKAPIPWFTAKLSNSGTSESEAYFNYSAEPLPFGKPVSEEALMLDYLEYPRDVNQLPDWYREAIGFNDVPPTPTSAYDA